MPTVIRKLGPGPAMPADEPLYDPDELLGIAPADIKVPFDPREMIARVVDGSRFGEYKPLWGTSLVINSVANSKVPHITVNLAASFGAGNYGMSGRSYDPRMIFAWAGSKPAVMGRRTWAYWSQSARPSSRARSSPSSPRRIPHDPRTVRGHQRRRVADHRPAKGPQRAQ